MTSNEYLALEEKERYSANLYFYWMDLLDKARELAYDAIVTDKGINENDRQEFNRLFGILNKTCDFIEGKTYQYRLERNEAREALKTPEAKEAWERFNEERREHYKKMKKLEAEAEEKREAEMKRLAEEEGEPYEEEKPEYEPLSDFDIECIKADERIKGEKENLDYFLSIKGEL